jgi:hypothetical protein
MHQNVEAGDDKFQNYCMAWGVDGISFNQFKFICTSKCWNDYTKSSKLMETVCDVLKITDLLDNFTVSPSFNDTLPSTLTYSVNFDDGRMLYLGMDIAHDINTGIYNVYITEYDARLCESKDRSAYHYSNIFGPFFDDMPLNNQELYEKTRMWHTGISKHLRNISNVSN